MKRLLLISFFLTITVSEVFSFTRVPLDNVYIQKIEIHSDEITSPECNAAYIMIADNWYYCNISTSAGQMLIATALFAKKNNLAIDFVYLSDVIAPYGEYPKIENIILN